MPPADHPSTASIAGHPVHPMLVTVPIGSAVLTFLSDLWAARSGEPSDASRSRWLLGMTVLSGLLAAPTGLIDALTIKAARGSSATWLHAGGNAAMLVIGLLEWSRRRTRPRASEAWPSVTGVMVGILTVTGWLGGELVYRKRIGVHASESSGDTGPAVDATTEVAGETPGLPGGDEPAEGRPDVPAH
jgi:uncharacterized membrane protein